MPKELKHVISLLEFTRDEIEEIFSQSAEIKQKLRAGERSPLLQGRVLTLLFEKPSLRTRNSFEAGMMQLGGGSIFLSTKEAGLQGRESLADVARVLSGYSDAIAMRTFSQQLIDDIASHSSCPVINGLSDESHPCQALTDLFTLREVFGKLEGRRLVYLGDGNNVAKSLAILSSMMGVELTVCAPSGYELTAAFLDQVRQQVGNCSVTQVDDPRKAVQQAEVVYTDVWASMGQESEADERKQVFAPYQVNAELMSHAPSNCKFMHDLPARRGMEVTDEVIDGPTSIVFQQAENRMHLAKGLLVWLLT